MVRAMGIAIARLDTFHRAEVIETSRLHIALPCLAFGTPVIIRRSEVGAISRPERLTVLDTLGIRADEAVTADVGPWSTRYINWLSACLGLELSTGPPRSPVPC